MWTSILKSLSTDNFSPCLLILSQFQFSYIQLLQRVSLNWTINLLSSNSWNSILHACPITDRVTSFLVINELNGMLTICLRHCQTPTDKNISLFSFLINFILFSQKTKDLLLTYVCIPECCFWWKGHNVFPLLFISIGKRAN